MSIIIVQVINQEIRIVGHIEHNGENINYYCNELYKFARLHNIYYEHNFIPHDGNVRELLTGTMRADTIRENNFNVFVVPRTKTIYDGIDKVRALFKTFYIHKTNCDYLVKAIRNYHKAYDEKLKCYLSMSKHDWIIHARDALRTFCVGLDSWYLRDDKFAGSSRYSVNV